MSNTYTPTTGFTVIRCSGRDTQEFLQNQLTGDVAGIREPDWGLSGYCSPKGRLLAIFFVCRQGADFLLLTDASIAEGVLARLRMYVLRAEVTLELCPEQSLAFKNKKTDELPEAAISGNLPVLRDALTIGVAAKASPDNSYGDRLFRKLCIESGIPVLSAALSEMFIPQSLNLDLVDGVSFQKGCYPGQEVVARVRYRGAPKQRMIGASMEITHAPTPGTEVNCRDGASGRNGTVVCAVSGPDMRQALLLASVPVAVLKHPGSEGLSIAGLPLTVHPFPYPVPLEVQRS